MQGLKMHPAGPAQNAKQIISYKIKLQDPTQDFMSKADYLCLNSLQHSLLDDGITKISC